MSKEKYIFRFKFFHFLDSRVQHLRPKSCYFHFTQDILELYSLLPYHNWPLPLLEGIIITFILLFYSNTLHLLLDENFYSDYSPILGEMTPDVLKTTLQLREQHCVHVLHPQHKGKKTKFRKEWILEFFFVIRIYWALTTFRCLQESDQWPIAVSLVDPYLETFLIFQTFVWIYLSKVSHKNCSLKPVFFQL